MVLWQIVNRGLRSFFGRAHPDPCKAHVLPDRVRADLRGWGDDILAGNADALPAAVERHAMIAALDGVALKLSHRERRKTVRAHIIQPGDTAVLFSVEN